MIFFYYQEYSNGNYIIIILNLMYLSFYLSSIHSILFITIYLAAIFLIVIQFIRFFIKAIIIDFQVVLFLSLPLIWLKKVLHILKLKYSFNFVF